jgi:RNA polymerase sigma factor (sigma-70 family)
MANLTDDRRKPELHDVPAAAAADLEAPSRADDASSRRDAAESARSSARTSKPGKEAELPPAEPVSQEEVIAFLRDPWLTRAMRRAVRERVNDADVDDVVQEARLGIARKKELPKEQKRRKQYALAIARNKAIKWYDRKEKGRPEEVALDDARDVADDEGDIRRALASEYLARIAAGLPPTQRTTFECLVRHLMGDSLVEMARGMDVQYDTLYKRVTTLRRQLRTAGRVAVGLSVVLLVEDDWSSCRIALDEARGLDPQGEGDPLVQAARTDLRDAAAHPDQRWSPRHPRVYEASGR